MRKMISMFIVIGVLISFTSCGITGVTHDTVSSYEGPIFSLDSLEKVEGISVNREIKMAFPNTDNLGSANYDFVNDTFYGKAFRYAEVLDQYEIRNGRSEEITMQMIYPFEAKFASSSERVPKISSNVGNIEPQIILGRTLLTQNYADISALNNQHCYDVLMSEGAYIKESLESYSNTSSLDESVKVYKFEGIGCRTQAQEKMELEVSIARGADNSQVYTYGFDTFGYQNNKDVLGVSVPLENDMDFEKDAYIIVSGDDIEISDILCYRTAQKEYYAWEEIKAFELVTYESTLEDVMSELINEYRKIDSMQVYFGDYVTNQKFLDASKQFLVDTEKERGVGIISLDYSVFATIEAEYGMHFMLFDVTIPANDSVNLNIRYNKPANVVLEDKEGYDTYDMILQRVSNLDYEMVQLGLILDDFTQIRVGGPDGDILKDGTYDVTSWSDVQMYLEKIE